MPKKTKSQVPIDAAPEKGQAGPSPEIPGRPATSDCEEVRFLAYSYWKARGCPEGSPEADWFRAEQDLRTKAAEQAATGLPDSNAFQ